MRSIMFFALLLLATIANKSFAADWVYVISNKDSDLTADKNSIRRSGDEARLWVKETHKNLYKRNSESKPYRVSMTLYAFKCSGREGAVVSNIFFADLERTIRTDSFKVNGEPAWRDVSPESINEALMNFACSTT
jgi:hypothetical protein